MVTDLWCPPWHPLSWLDPTGRLSGRWHSGLSGASVLAANVSFLAFEVGLRLGNKSDWQKMAGRNLLFGAHGIDAVRRLKSQLAGQNITVFAYSYAARDIFHAAKALGWTTVLGQVDPGPREEQIENGLLQAHPDWACTPSGQKPEDYWARWHEECAAADYIVVNSRWSGASLVESGVPRTKIRVIPLAFEPGNPSTSTTARRQSGPLRVLFLGQVIARKGIFDLLETARNLAEEDIHFDVVGPHEPIPFALPPNMTFHGSANRAAASDWFASSDVFVLPTHSDGFAITQLEAMAAGLPVIATPCCGEVVESGRNGFLIPPGRPDMLAAALQDLLRNRPMLAAMSEAARKTSASFGLGRLASTLTGLEEMLGEPTRR